MALNDYELLPHPYPIINWHKTPCKLFRSLRRFEKT